MTATATRRRLLWALGAVVLTSAVWATAIVAIGRPLEATPTADLSEFHAVDDLCAAADLSPFKSAGFSARERKTDTTYRNPKSVTSKHPAVDTMWCTIEFKSPGEPQDREIASSVLRIVIRLYKQSDPAPEFQASYGADVNDELGTPVLKSEISRVSGIGDDAYQIITPGAETSPNAQLWVRVGWMVYSATWSQHVSEGQNEVKLLPGNEVVELLKDVTTKTVPALHR
ncbi:hypothetical protein [Nocardia inohanensis]|uniref:hypothetical protein n=1 Tax=Nocardia inohanensis TaxID=209246 RepID=UPI000AAC9394|nr:hypothetical protein [Nocardia inohanensis]